MVCQHKLAVFISKYPWHLFNPCRGAEMDWFFFQHICIWNKPKALSSGGLFVFKLGFIWNTWNISDTDATVLGAVLFGLEAVCFVSSQERHLFFFHTLLLFSCHLIFFSTSVCFPFLQGPLFCLFSPECSYCIGIKASTNRLFNF